MATTENGIYYPYDYNVTADVPEDMKKMAESIEKNVYKKLKDADETIKQNLVETQKDVQKNKQDISDIKEEQQTQNNNIKNLQKNDAQQDKSIEALQKENTELKEECSRLRQDLKAFPSGQAEGEYITLQDSADSRFNMFRVGGNSKQETRSGKNLCDNNFKNYTIDNYGYKKIIDSEENLIASLIDKDTSVDLTGIYFGFTHTGKDAIEGMVWLINNGVETANKTNQGIYQYLSFYPADDETFNKIFARYDIQVEKGTTATDYEPYGASPSPEYPSVIQNVEDNLNITVCNKNLNNSEMELGGFNFLTGELASSTTEMRNKEPIYLNKANKITISTNIDGIWAYFFYKKDKSTVIPGSYKNNSNFITIEVPEEAEYIMYRFNSTDLNLPIILEIGENVTDYIQNEQQVFTFPLAEGQKLYKGDYLAEDGIHHVRKQIELDGTENWSENINYTTENLLVAQVLITNAKNQTANVLSNYFLYKSTSTEKNTLRFASTLLLITIDKNQFADVPALKTWLAKQKQAGTPVTIEYELAEEEIEAYTPEQQEAYNKIVQTAKSYKNVTNIYSPDPVSPVFEVNYRKDIESMINNSLNNVNQQILNIV